MSKVPMTAAGRAALEDELKRRIGVERIRIAERVRNAAADDPNLFESSEFQVAATEQELNETRIAELRGTLVRADVIDISKLGGKIITFGATVVLTDENGHYKKVFQIVGEPEADAARGRISIMSPVARALIGKSKGASVEVAVPQGMKCYKIYRVQWDNRRLSTRKKRKERVA